MAIQKHISHIFNQSQHSAGDHPKLVKVLKKFYHQYDNNEEFLEAFIECFKCALIHGERETTVNLCLDFAAKFATSFEMENEDPDDGCHPFFEGLFEFLIANHNVRSQAVRFRVCQFINRLLEGLSDSASISADLFDKIYDAMLERIQDRIASVRVQAVVALQRLQDPTNKECPVIKALVYHLERDPHPEVRRAVLKALGCNYYTLEYVLERLRDVKDLVRRQAFIFISERVHMRSLSIANRVTILKLGLKDRAPVVKAIVQEKLIPAWITAMEGSLFNLLRGLDVEGCSDIGKQVLEVWFKTLNYKEITSHLEMGAENLLSVEALKPETALYWRTAVSFLRSEGVHAADALDTIMPEMTAFGKYLKSYIIEKLNFAEDMELLSMEFIVGQLLEIAPYFDLADEAGRLNLCRDLIELLQNDKTSPFLTRTMVKCVSIIEPNLEVRIVKLLEVISELREPLTQVEIPISEEEQRRIKLETAQCRVRLNELKEELEEAIKSQNFALAQEIQPKILGLEEKLHQLAIKPAENDVEIVREERDDPRTLLKCLSVICELLKTAPMTKLTKELDQLLTTLILPCVEKVDPAVRNGAFEALGCLCTCDEELAKQRLLLFVQAVQMDHTILQVTTAKILFDLVQLFGLQSFEDKESESSLATILTDLLDSEDADVQTVAVEGFTKLLVSSRIESATVISRLVIFLFHPLTQDNVRLRQVLNVFFPFFASMSMANQQQLEDAFLITVRTIQKAPCTSPLAEIDLSMIVKLFVNLTNESVLVKKPAIDHNIHDQLALKLGQQALRHPDTGESKVYIKALLQLQMSFSNSSNTRDVHTLIKKLLRIVKDKSSMKLLEQLESVVAKHLVETNDESTAESTADEAEEPAASKSRRPRIRQLCSKAGATLLMDVTASDADMSLGSPDVFFSPSATSTQQSKVSDEEIVIGAYSSSTSSTAASNVVIKPLDSETKEHVDANQKTLIAKNEDGKLSSLKTPAMTKKKQALPSKRGRAKTSRLASQDESEDGGSPSATSAQTANSPRKTKAVKTIKGSSKVTPVEKSDEDFPSGSASSGDKYAPQRRRTRSSIKSENDIGSTSKTSIVKGEKRVLRTKGKKDETSCSPTQNESDEGARSITSTKSTVPLRKSRFNKTSKKQSEVTTVEESDEEDILSSSISSGEKIVPPKRRTRSSLKSDATNSDEDVLPPTPPQRSTLVTRKVTRR